MIQGHYTFILKEWSLLTLDIDRNLLEPFQKFIIYGAQNNYSNEDDFHPFPWS